MVIDSDSAPQDPIASFESFFKTFERVPDVFEYREKITEAYTRSENYITVLFEDLLDFNPPLANYMKRSPMQALNEATEAFKNIIAIDAGGLIDFEEHYSVRLATNNNSNEVVLRELRAVHMEELVYVKGIVIRMAAPRPQLVVGHFECAVCQASLAIPQEGLEYTKPELCSNPNCNNKRKFALVPELSEYIDYQRITIQESPEELESGTVPRTIPIIMKYGLVDMVRPGERVKVTGIYRSEPVDMARGKKSTICKPYILANNVTGFKSEDEEIDISDEDLTQILELSQDPQIHYKIANSMAPAIYGQEHLKMAACFSIFGGVEKKKQTGTKIRGDIHVLFMGDPGTGKSQILQYCSKLVSRSIYTSGKGASAAGLTAAIVKESETSGMSLEAGALVLASGGIACIDEFDKMDKNDRSAIHEAMEQQTVSIAKAGIIATLQSKTAVIAAANPKFGRYNEYKTPAENINLPAPILSRFDLVFIVKDRPEADMDARIADFILQNHMDSITEDYAGTEDDRPVNQLDIIPTDLLRKYIRHARNTCFPKLNHESAQRIKEFYLELRGMGAEDNNAPVSIVARYLEALIRMSEALAKMQLSEYVEVEHVNMAVELMQRSMREIGFDEETGQIDMDRLLTGASRSSVRRMESILNLIRRLQLEANNAPIKIVDFIAEVNQNPDIDEEFALETIDVLVNEGTLYKPRPDEIKLTLNLD